MLLILAAILLIIAIAGGVIVHAKPPLYAPLAANTYLRTRN